MVPFVKLDTFWVSSYLCDSTFCYPRDALVSLWGHMYTCVLTIVMFYIISFVEKHFELIQEYINYILITSCHIRFVYLCRLVEGRFRFLPLVSLSYQYEISALYQDTLMKRFPVSKRLKSASCLMDKLL